MKKLIKQNDQCMRIAIREARKNLKTMEGGPFGACIVKGRRVLAVARNTVLKEDATCHAEINAIRKASKKVSSFDLTGCVIYSTTEPCPMCFSAIHWARIDTVIYGTTIKDAERIGFNELKINGSLLKALGKSKVRLKKTQCIAECRKLFADWQKLAHKRLY